MTKFDKMNDLIDRKEFDNFWECFSFLKDASFDETDSLLISMDRFKGDIWSKVISANKQAKPFMGMGDRYRVNIMSSAATSFNTFAYTERPTIEELEGTLAEEPVDNVPTNTVVNDVDDLIIEINLMTSSSNPVYRPIYKSYINTRKYKKVLELESHIKTLKLRLETELAIDLFNNGLKIT